MMAAKKKNQNRFKVNFAGILEILSKNLYSTEDVFVRELIQNAFDAIKQREMLDASFRKKGKINFEWISDGNKVVLLIEDNGIGLTENEVETFLSYIGSSSKRVDQNENDFIGKFGIGLLSCFMVSDTIHLITRSCNSTKAIKWVASIEGEYETTVLKEEHNIGTKIFLEIKNPDRFNEENVTQLIEKYSQFLSYPICFSKNEQITRVKQFKFPWTKKLNEQVANEFASALWGESFNAHIPFASKSGKTKGMAYISSSPSNLNANNRCRVYLKGMLNEECNSTLLPGWFNIGPCILNSEELTPTASRESVQKDEIFEKVKLELEESLLSFLLANIEKEEYSWIFEVHALILKSASIENESLLKVLGGKFVFQTSFGELSLNEIIKYSGETVLFTNDIDKYKQLKPLATAQSKLIVNGGFVFDSAIIHLYCLSQEINCAYISEDEIHNFFEKLNVEENELWLDFVLSSCKHFEQFNIRIECARFSPHEVPSIFYIGNNFRQNRDVKRTIEQIQQDSPWGNVLKKIEMNTLENDSVLYLNVDNNLVQSVRTVAGEKHLMFLNILYLNALLMGNYPLSLSEKKIMNDNLYQLLIFATK